METKYGFTKLNSSEFSDWLADLRVGRTVLNIQQHHTFRPSYSNFTGDNHFELQRNMKNYHTRSNGWMDIAQHFTIFPDGMIVTGRSLEHNPAGITGRNQDAICIENLGYFDLGFDKMHADQQQAIVNVTARLCQKFNLPINTNSIVYHHWFSSKSCPGTNFFGGNTRGDCEANFLPLVNEVLQGHNPLISDANILKYAVTTAQRLNVRTGPHYKQPKATDREPLQFGAVIRVYKEENGWLKISNSAQHWVSGKFTQEATRYFVTASSLNVRSGAGTQHPKVDQVIKGDQVFVTEESGSWSKIALDDKWVHSSYIKKF